MRDVVRTAGALATVMLLATAAPGYGAAGQEIQPDSLAAALPSAEPVLVRRN